MCDLSIIIVTYNSEKDIVSCLDSIEHTKEDLELEIFVVDNASRDDTVKIVQTRYPYVHLIANNSNIGFPAANNQAISIAKANSILLLNPDTILHKNALKALCAFFAEHSSASVVGLNIRNPDGSFQKCIRRLPSILSIILETLGLDRAFNRSPIFNFFGYGGLEPKTSQTVGCVSGAALAFNRAALYILKGLDIHLFYYEDIDFCLRAWKSNIPVYFLPNAQIVHIGGQSELSNKALVVYHSSAGRVSYFRKHHSLLVFTLVKIIIIIELLFRLLIRGIQSCFPNQYSKYASRIKGYLQALAFTLFGKQAKFN